MQKRQNNHLVFVVISMIVTLLVVKFMLTEDFDNRSHASEGDTAWVAYRSSGFESGNFNDWDQINAADGTITVIDNGTEAPQTPTSGNAKVAKAYQQGSNTPDGHFSRTIWNLPSWTDQTYATQAYFYLPTGFYASMQGAVQLIGWDTNPILGDQMRLIIYNSDKKARLFVNENYVGREITDNFAIPEGQWVKLRIEQRINQDNGWSRVYMNDALVAQGSATYCVGNATRCNDTFANEPVTRMRYGLVAIADQVQLKPLTVYFDDVSLQLGPNDTGTPSPVPTPTSSPSPVASVAPTPIPTPQPSPVPSPVVNTAPIIETSSLSPARVGRRYTTDVKGYDLNVNDTLTMTIAGLPPELRVTTCSSQLNRKRNTKDISCTIDGTPSSALTASLTVVLQDNTGLQTQKNISFTIR